MNTVVLNLEPIAHLTDEQFYQLCVANRDLNLEMNATGELIIVPPVGGESGNREAELITDLNNWNRQAKLGKVFSSSTIFILPNGNPQDRLVEIYRLGKAVEVIQIPAIISGEDILPGFELQVQPSATNKFNP
jgi:Uma2 family endonuclease